MRKIEVKRKLTVMGLIASLALVSVMVASAASTTKTLSTNFTLVNLGSGANTANIAYYTPTGDSWRDTQIQNFTTRGEQLIVRQYQDPQLPAGSGSVVVGGQAALGAVVQIRALNQTPTSGAYSGATSGATSVNIPLVTYRGDTFSGPRTGNSQIIVQNTSTVDTNFRIDLIDRNNPGTNKSFNSPSVLRQGASYTFDLADQGAGLGLPENWFGSAVVVATTNSGELTAVSNFFIGADAMLTFGGFTNPGTKWVAPLFTSRLATNQLSTPLTVQNLGTAEIPARAVQVVCKPNSASGVTTDVVLENGTAIPVNASFSWNPVTDTSIPTDFQGSCTINTGSNPTVAFVQMRFIGTNNAAAYEALRGDSTDTTVVVPLVLRRLSNGFATAVTVSNFGDQPATVLLSYKAAAEAPPNLKCDGSLTLTIPAGGSIVQNHRVQNGAVNAVPEIDEGCTSSLIVTPAGGAPQPIGAFVQITTINNQPGDTYQAHDAFGIQ